MNGLERVMAALHGQAVDRRPVSLTLSLFGARLIHCDLETYYKRADCYVEGQMAVVERIDPDIVFGPVLAAYEGAAFGSSLHRLDDMPPNLRQPAAGSIKEALALQLPDPDREPHLLYLRETIRRLAAQLGSQKAIAAICLSPADLPIMLLGIDGWLHALIDQPEEASALIERCARHFCRWTRTLIDDGAHFIVMPLAFANPSLLTPSIIQRSILPSLTSGLSPVEAPLIMHAAGVPLAPFLDQFAALPKVVGFVLNAHDDVKLTRQRVSTEQVLIGNIDGASLFREDAEHTYARCRDLLNSLGTERHFVLGSSGPDIPMHTPVETIQAIVRAARDQACCG